MRRSAMPALFALLAVLATGPATGCAGAPGSAAGSTVEPNAPGTTEAGCRDTAGNPVGERRTMTIDGTQRSYLLAVPARAGTGSTTPLIVSLHGFGGSAAELDEHTRLSERAAARGIAVVTPDALGSPARWNFDHRPSGPDDYAFIDALVADLSGHLCIDPDRTFVAGSSNGAAFAGLLACQEPYRFAAVAMVIATVPSGCPGSVSPAVITIRGTADAHVPFAGTPELVAAYADRYGCTPVPITERPAEHVERTRYTGCRGASEVVLDAVVGGEHRWPGDVGSAATGTSAAGPGYLATDEILDFFERHPRTT